jgi:ureidoglycolate dehydrogenase (NAD+)
MPVFDPSRLENIMKQELDRRGVHPDSIRHVVGALVETSLRGVDSHGITLFPHYCRAVDAGRINKNPNLKVLTQYPSVALLDADHAFGHHAGSVAIEMARQMADHTGIGTVSVRNSTHFGAAAYYALQVSRKGYMAFAFTNADSLVKAYGSDRAFFGTNPICFSVPMRGEDPLCLDMATSQVSWNKIKIFRMNKKAVPEDWGFGPDGKPTNDPDLVKTLNPIGLYKGYGLGSMVEILCSLLASGPFALQVIPMFTRISERRSISHCFMVLDIGKFRPIDSFLDDMETMVEQVRSLPSLKSVSSVMVPGDPEKLVFSERSVRGIPIDEKTYEDFLLLSQDFSRALNP